MVLSFIQLKVASQANVLQASAKPGAFQAGFALSRFSLLKQKPNYFRKIIVMYSGFQKILITRELFHSFSYYDRERRCILLASYVKKPTQSGKQ